MTWIYPLNAILCGIACLGLTFAIGSDWRNIRPAWRAVLLAGTIEQGVLLYGCLEALHSRVPVEARAILFSFSIAALALSTVLALAISWRTGELTSPASRSDREQSR